MTTINPTPEHRQELRALLAKAAESYATMGREHTDARYGPTYESIKPEQTLYGQALDHIERLEAAALRVLEWWPLNSETTSLAGKNMGDSFAADIRALRLALNQEPEQG
jgi:hypothetical protein